VESPQRLRRNGFCDKEHVSKMTQRLRWGKPTFCYVFKNSSSPLYSKTSRTMPSRCVSV
jgi:hypothetical protein